MVLICISMMASGVEHFKNSNWSFVVFLLRALCQFDNPFYWVVCFLMFRLLSSLYILDTKPLPEVKLEKIFLPFLGCLFNQKLVNAMKFHLKTHWPYILGNHSLIKKFFIYVYVLKYSPYFCFYRFRVPGLMLRSLIYLELRYFFCRVRDRLLLVLLHVQRPFVEHAVPFPVSIFGIFVKTPLTTVVWPCV